MRCPAVLPATLLALLLCVGACSSTEANPTPAVDLAAIASGETIGYGSPPDYPDGAWSIEVAANLGGLVAAFSIGATPSDELAALAESGDPRLAWPLADLLRFSGEPMATEIAANIAALTGIDIEPERPWASVVDHLIAWDLPAPPEYFTFKRDFYSQVDPRWGQLFTDVNTIDWRHVSWGGVFIDDRPLGSTSPCSCIPALDDPAVTTATIGDWYPDDAVVFGVTIGSESRAYPKNIMEIHEMVNDTLDGRRIAIPYCTLCGSAQAYLTDDLGPGYDQPVLRTSGLLIRSNKMMYDVTSKSFVDTFRGDATSGPLGQAGVRFEPVSVVTSTWGQWKAAHPETTIVAEDGGVDRTYPLDPLQGRDDNGPIFPVGAINPRLPAQEPVLGLVTTDADGEGRALAVHVASAITLLEAGERVVIDDIEIMLDGDGIRAVDAASSDIGGHQAFWFAWSQFRPRTALWPHDYQ